MRAGFLPCWMWTGRTHTSKMIPQVVIGKTILSARRLIMSMFYNWDAKNVYIKMSCKNESCVNPQHMIISEYSLDRGAPRRTIKKNVIDPVNRVERA